VCASHSIMGVHEVTDELAEVEIARAENRLVAREKHHVETHLAEAITARSERSWWSFVAADFSSRYNASELFPLRRGAI